MKIAIDGGSFQQGIAAGIFNVQIGLMNAVTRQRADIKFVLVGDSRLPAFREDLLDFLIDLPETCYGPVSPAYGMTRDFLLTTDPDIKFRVDGTLVNTTLVNGQACYYGPRPRFSFWIESRVGIPKETLNLDDGRELGIALRGISFRSAAGEKRVDIRSQDFSTGLYGLEGDLRWTNGALKIPLSLFPGEDGSVYVIPEIAGTIPYRVGDSLFDKAYKTVVEGISALELAIETARLAAQLKQMGVVAYVANHFMPIHFQALKSFAILYDIIPEILPEYFGKDALLNFSHCMRLFSSADHVFSISNCSRMDLAGKGVDPSRITTISIDASPWFKRLPRSQVTAVINKFGISRRPYILMVGTLEPRKNHDRVVRAYEQLPRYNRDIDLVIVGKYGWGAASLADTILESGLGGSVHILNDVSNEELAGLYNGALFLAYMSLYEGFGLPVLEAMACGCPVLTSNRSSLPEVAGSAGLLVDPSDTTAIREGLSEMISNPRLRKRLSKLGLDQRKSFSWDATAKRMIDVLIDNPGQAV